MATDTVTLNYSDSGQGTPVVLLHGFPLSGAIWHEQQQISDRFRVITPDLRGYGRSPAPSGVYEMDLLARDVLALLPWTEVFDRYFCFFLPPENCSPLVAKANALSNRFRPPSTSQNRPQFVVATRRSNVK